MNHFKNITYSVRQRCCIITLSRPEKKNALHYTMVRELKEALQAAETDPEVRAVLIQAAGDVFSAGLDMEYLSKLQDYGFEENFQDSVHFLELFTKLHKYNKLVIALVQGKAIGAGATLVALADFSLAYPAAQISFPAVKYGYIPALDMVFLSRKIGEAKTRELLLLGEPMPAVEAQKIGLFSHVLEPEAAEPFMQTLLEKVCSENSIGAIEFTKRMLADLAAMPFQETLAFVAKMNAHTRTTAEARQGIDFFQNKKKPTW